MFDGFLRHSRFLRRLQCTLRFLNRASVRLFLVLCSRALLLPVVLCLRIFLELAVRVPAPVVCRAPTPVACSAHSSCTVRISNTPTLAFAACPVSGRVLRASLCGQFVFRAPSRSFDRSSISARATRRSSSLPSPFCTMSVASSRLVCPSALYTVSNWSSSACVSLVFCFWLFLS